MGIAKWFEELSTDGLSFTLYQLCLGGDNLIFILVLDPPFGAVLVVSCTPVVELYPSDDVY